MRIPLPRGGQHDGTAKADQPLGTSSDLLNVLPFDPVTGREALARRPGHTKECLVQVASGRVRAMANLPNDVANITYASLGDSVTDEADISVPSVADSKGCAVDRQGNLFVIDGKTAIAKFNSSGALVAKLALQVADPLHEIRALHVDRFDRVYVGVSTGGSQTTARIWCYAQEEGNTFRLVWQMEPGEYIERIVTSNDALYYAGNRPDSQESFIRGFTGFDIETPAESFTRTAPYPINDLALSPKDGSLFVASESNSTRGTNPLSPDTTAKSEDWTYKNLASWQKRVWSYYDATDADNMILAGVTGATTNDAATCNIWLDSSGNNRHWYADATGVGTHTGPTFKTNGFLHFNGTSNSMRTVAPQSTDKASRAEQLSAIPTYAGAQSVTVMLVRVAVSSTQRIILAQDGTTTRALVSNSAPSGAVSGTASDNAIRWHETGGTASDAASSSPAATAPAGNGTTPLSGPIGPGGYCVVTIVCDGRVHDSFGSATRSQVRINGMVCDRWQSASFTSTNPTQLGYFAGTGLGAFDIVRMIVLSDWTDANDQPQRLITTPDNPDNPFSFSTASTTEIEQLEGWIAHAGGTSHMLPGGQAVWLYDNAGGTLDDGNTVTIAGTVYTAKAALTPAANEFLIGASLTVSLRNLRNAINGQGTPGTDYGGATVPHASVRALGPVGYQNSSPPRAAILLRQVNPYSAAFAVSKTEAASQTLGWANATLTAAATATTGTNSADAFQTAGAVALAKNTNWYPHAYFLRKLANRTLGGPPRADGSASLALPSKPGLFMSSLYGLVGKINPANGSVAWVATSNWDNGGTGLGGVGYGVIISSSGDVYSMGERQALVVAPAVTADPIDVRKIIDNQTSFSITTGTTATTAWQDDPGAWTNHYPRMAVDKFDQVYVPVFQSAAATSLIVYARLGTTLVGNDNANEICTVTNLTGDPRTYAVAVHPTYPDYPASFTATRAQYVYLATELTGKFSAYKLGLISATNTTGTGRTITRLAVSGGSIVKYGTLGITGATYTEATKKITKTGAFTDYVFTATDVFVVTAGTGATLATYSVASRIDADNITLTTSIGAGADGQTNIAGTLHFATVVGNGVLDTNAQYIDVCVGFRNAFFFDGRKPYRYDAKTGLVTAYVATDGGEVEGDYRICVIWRGRIIMAHRAGNAAQWRAMEVGNPFGADIEPASGANDAMAVTEETALAGQPPDPIQSLYAIDDDLMLIGGMTSIRMIAGDPARPSTKIQLVTDKVGTTFGPAWARDASGVAYFFGSDANVYALIPGTRNLKCLSQPESEGDPTTNIHERLRSINFATHYPKLVFDTRWQMLHVLVIPYAASEALVTCYRWHKLTRSWWPTTYVNPSHQPTAVAIVEGDTAADKHVSFGCGDGYIRFEDPTAETDDGTRIEARAMIGPLVPESELKEAKVNSTRALLADALGGCLFETYASDTADTPGSPVRDGELRPGRNHVTTRMAGAHIWIMLRFRERCAVQSMLMELRAAGDKVNAPVR